MCRTEVARISAIVLGSAVLATATPRNFGSGSGLLEPTPSPTAAPSGTDSCNRFSCSRDCGGGPRIRRSNKAENNKFADSIEDVLGFGKADRHRRIIPILPCGWDSETNMCVSGGVTTLSERLALLETNPGDCSQYTNAPTAAPTDRYAYLANHISGQINCGDVVNGDISTAVNVGGGRSPDHFYSFTATSGSRITFDSCSSDFDTSLKVLRLENGEFVEVAAQCNNCAISTCGLNDVLRLDFGYVGDGQGSGFGSGSGSSYSMGSPGGGSPIRPFPTLFEQYISLDAGDYVVQVERGGLLVGPAPSTYTLSMFCDTAAPTHTPTSAPTTTAPVNLSPSAAPTSAPSTWASANPTEIVFTVPLADLNETERQDLITGAIAEIVARFGGAITADDISVAISTDASGNVLLTFTYSGRVVLDRAQVEDVENDIADTPIQVTVNGRTFTGAPPAASSGSPTGDDDDDLSGGAIAGIIIAVLALILLILLAIKFAMARNADVAPPSPKKQSNANFGEERMSMTNI